MLEHVELKEVTDLGGVSEYVVTGIWTSRVYNTCPMPGVRG